MPVSTHAGLGRDHPCGSASAIKQALGLRTRLAHVLLAADGIEQAVALLGDAAGTGLELTLTPLGGECDHAFPLRLGEATVGWLRPVGGPVTGDRHTAVATGARVLALAIQDERARVQALAARPSTLLASILGRLPHDVDHASRIAAHAGLRFDRPLAVLCIAADHGAGAGAVQAQVAGSLVCEDEPTLLIAPGRDPRPLATAIARNLGSPECGLPTIGFDDEPVGLRDLAGAVDRAQRAVAAAPALNRHGETVAFSEIGVDGALATIEGQAREHAERLLRPLLDYDRAHGTSLIGTLEAFLEEQARPARAARRLFLHVNSLAYRLRRIEDVAGVRLDDPDTRFELELALRTQRR